MTRMLVLLILAVLSIGCTGSLPEARSAGVQARTAGASQKAATPVTAERCATLDDRRQLWGSAAKGLAILSGASGIATIPVNNDNAETALAAASLGLGALAATAVALSESAGESWVRDCE